MATATPEVRRSQGELAEDLARVWGLRSPDMARWRRIVRGTGIQSRAAVAPIADIPNLTTGQRMTLYEAHAPALASAPARAALIAAGLGPGAVTDLIVVSCTGFSAPGVDLALVDRLGLAPTVRRTVIGFMGCFGAVTGLRAALGVCAAEPSAVVLLVCVELCSLHLRGTPDVENLVASALFADGAAAAVLTGRDAARVAAESRDGVVPDGRDARPTITDHDGRDARPTITDHDGRDARPTGLAGMFVAGLGRSRVAPGTAGAMSWRITDAGFAMTLSADVPARLGEAVRTGSLGLCGGALALHPGGAAILDAIEGALPPTRRADVGAARAVMREHGNMSSPSVLFVLERIATSRRIDRATLAAFGPGLSVETIDLAATE